MYLCADSINMISLWVDALYATHWEFNNNKVEVMLMEASEILSFSRKQNLNTVSSTEAERVGISDALGMMMWTQYFLEAQGYTIDILFQDNKSTIMPENNGSSSMGKNSNHTKNRYLLIADKLHQEYLEIHYNPTGEMLVDYQSKPQQGNLLGTMRVQLMN